MHVKVEHKRFDATPAAWLKHGKACGELANKWSDRSDIIAYIGEGAGMGIAAALWNPVLAEMELNVEQAFGKGADPKWIGDLLDRDVQFEHPAAMGAVLHEAGHAKHTKYDFSEIRRQKDKRYAMLVEMFEEIRIETRMMEVWPKNRAFLRACALKLVIADMEEAGKQAETDHVMGLSKLMILSLGRVVAGVLDDDDIKPVTDGATKVLGEPLVASLVGLMVEATQHKDDEDWQPLRKLAIRWCELLEEAGFKTQPTEEEKQQMREAMKAIAEAFGAIMEGIGEMAEDAEIRARGEAAEQADIEQGEREAKEAEQKAKEQAKAEEEANEVFGHGAGTRDLKGATKSTLVKERVPTEAEHAAAVTIARMLERAKYRDRVVVRRTTAVPPGRLRSRAAVQSAAEAARGAMRTAEPWSSKRRFHVEDPNLRLGMMTDVSGSMRSAMEPMAAANWIFSEAVRRIQGQVASVYFGNSVFPGLRPGEHLERVKIYTAADGTERFNTAFKALNGKLDLLGSSGARLLVVVSDLHHTATERVAERQWFTRCAQEGVAVVVIPFGARQYLITETCEGLPVRVLRDVDNPVEAAMEIGRAAAEALEQAGNRG